MKKKSLFVFSVVCLLCFSIIFTSCSKCSTESKTKEETSPVVTDSLTEDKSVTDHTSVNEEAIEESLITDEMSEELDSYDKNEQKDKKTSKKDVSEKKSEPVVEKKIEKLNISYKTERETAPKSFVVNSGTALTRENVPILASKGYEFLGWFEDGRRIEAGYIVTKDLNLVAQWKVDEPPKPVSNAKGTGGDGEITITWRNPGNLDFDKVIISRADASDIEISKTEFGIGENGSAKITGLTNGVKYTFSLKSVDKGGKESSIVSTDAVPMNSFNEGPISLAAGTEGTFGSKGTYLMFGYYPKSLKADSVEIYDVAPIERNGLTLYSGSDGYYYTKTQLKPFPYGRNYRFDNGTPIAKTGEEYFKVEPIKWRIIDENFTDATGSVKGELLLAEDVVAAALFHEELNNYERSSLRKFLNGKEKDSFINTAFSAQAQKKIIPVTIDNSPASTTDVGGNITPAKGCNNTTDKIFVLSEYEATKSEYGFEAFDQSGLNSSRMKYSTEYARATGCNCNIAPDFRNKAWWWVRSPYSGNSVLAHYVGSKGEVSDYTSINESSGGVVPALVIAK